jgi:hypothetical protein
MKAGIMQPEKTSIARKGLGKHISAAKNTQATIEELLRTMFSVPSVQSGYKIRELVNWSEQTDPSSRQRGHPTVKRP